MVTVGMTQASTKGSLSPSKELDESELVSQLLQNSCLDLLECVLWLHSSWLVCSILVLEISLPM